MECSMRQIKPCEIQTFCKKITEGRNGAVRAMLLLYKDARYDMAVLDELYGDLGWQTHYESINGVLFCTISVWDPKRSQWVSKTSNGTESNMDAKKGEASDALKRAGFLWGIGRELYTAPRIYIDLKEKEYYKDQKGSYKMPDWIEFFVSKIEYDEKKFISSLEIVDYDGNVRFTYPTKFKKGVSTPPTKPLVQTVSNIQAPETQYFKPMKDFDATKVYDELVARIGREQAGQLLKSKGFASKNATFNMSLEQYYEIVKDADKIFCDLTVAKEAGSNA